MVFDFFRRKISVVFIGVVDVVDWSSYASSASLIDGGQSVDNLEINTLVVHNQPNAPEVVPDPSTGFPRVVHRCGPVIPRPWGIPGGPFVMSVDVCPHAIHDKTGVPTGDPQAPSTDCG